MKSWRNCFDPKFPHHSKQELRETASTENGSSVDSSLSLGLAVPEAATLSTRGWDSISMLTRNFHLTPDEGCEEQH
jgi:hypothetical protein